MMRNMTVRNSIIKTIIVMKVINHKSILIANQRNRVNLVSHRRGHKRVVTNKILIKYNEYILYIKLLVLLKSL